MPGWKAAKVWSNLRYYVLRLQFISLITTNFSFIWSEREFYILSRKLDSIIWPVGGPKIYVTKLHGHRRSKNTDSFTFKTDQTFNLHPKLKNWFNYLTRGGPKSVTKLHGRVIFFLRNPDSVIRYSYNEARWDWHGWYW